MSNQITPNPSVPTQVVAEVKFPRWINNLGIIPTSYKDSMSYYECLAWLCKFLEETVIPSVNENGEAVQELQNLYIELNSYVTHYFETLDVQEEINNKLDKMVEDGTLPEIVADYLNSKAVFGFDTVSDMLASTNLINGSYAETFGFYSKNDGANALYKIRTLSANETIDGMTILEMNSGNLVAELIIEDEIDVNKLGAKQDGSEDASPYFNKAFEIINNRWINNDTSLNTVVCGGKYLLQNSINMTPFSKLRNYKFTEIKSEVDGPCLILSYYNFTNLPSSSVLNKQDWFTGDLINFSQGAILYTTLDSVNTIGIQVGSSTSANEFNLSRFAFKNFRLKGFNIGIQYVGSNTYICHHEKISFEQCTIGVNFPTITFSNSGEKISFENCLFALGTYAFKWNVSGGFTLHVNNCSFDFLTYIIADELETGYHNAFINNSHLEGFTNIIKGLGDFSFVSISDCILVDSKFDQLFVNIRDNDSCTIILNNIKYTEQPTTDFTPERLQLNPELLLNNFIGTNASKSIVFKNNNLIQSIDSIPDDTYTLTGLIGDFSIPYVARINNPIVATDNYLYSGHKSIILTRSTAETGVSHFNLLSDYFPKKNDYVQAKFYVYNMTGTFGVKYFFYDQNKVLISETSTYMYTPDVDTYKNKWYMPFTVKQSKVPSNCSFIKVQLNCNNIFNGQDVTSLPSAKIGGLIVN